MLAGTRPLVYDDKLGDVSVCRRPVRRHGRAGPPDQAMLRYEAIDVMKRSSLGPDATAPCVGAGWEPSLDEILREPIVRQSDGPGRRHRTGHAAARRGNRRAPRPAGHRAAAIVDRDRADRAAMLP